MSAPSPAMGWLYVDVDELVRHQMMGNGTTGIFRVMRELCAALAARGARFVRHAPDRVGFVEIDWDGIAAAAAQVEARAKRLRARREGAVIRVLRPALHRFFRWLSPPVAVALGTVLRGIKGMASGLAALPGAVADAHSRELITALNERPFVLAHGDIVFAPGAPWEDPDFAARIAYARRLGLRFALLTHDLIPLRRPEWSDPTHTENFRQWFETTAPQADVLLAISHATAHDIEAYSERNSLPIAPPIVVPMGTGFRDPAPLARSERLPQPGTYVLFVSSIEARKNHILAFRVWRRLLDEMPEHSVPLLVIVGRPGPQSGDFLAQLANSRYLDGHILHIEDANDAELAALYRGCRFSLYPSLYEGWGLPVTESLYFGRPCLAAQVTSLPEAGGNFALYFDPDNLHDAVSMVRGAIEDEAGMERRAADIAAGFRAASWDDMAAAVCAACLR